ncbi:thiol:disulfide interchange protein DsbA/DsbL [Thiohalocapsa marina]|uniref:Thiol:disulfide interchange protein n=1 Tax=Thiohalocapsa marina TaxID=424902 RepID=A0A5M8FPM1_9GAMM|nr:thiol:disulfide interchange protein DsbA/DsbL [Thiohalocapsa marina]KAA6185061.1 thiol:disulfide interchange protein DsbA/DsbL [Thiohalocapsa marina]
MMMTRREFQVGLLGLLGTALAPRVVGAQMLVEGRDWRPLSPPQPSAEPERIEVLEFFSYGCSHCSQMNPLITEWAEALPSDILFRRVPVTFGRGAWVALARLFYALEFGGHLAQLDQAVFDAVTRQRMNLYTERNILKWIAEQGLDADAFAKVYNGFAVEMALRKAADLERRMGIDAVPRIVVDGRYVVTGDGAAGHAGLIRIAEQLVEKARVQRG